MSKFSSWLVAGLLVVGMSAISNAEAEPKLKAMILTGQSNHHWTASTQILQKILEQSSRFEVDVVTSPGQGQDMSSFKPDFANYDVIVLVYTGDSWPNETKQAFVNYVSSGGGVVSFHESDNAFPDWPEFNEIIGVGGWNGRDENSGPFLYWEDGKIVRDTSPGPGGNHGDQHVFQVVTRAKDHPIMRGLPEKWSHGKDELYRKLRGPAKNLTVLATAYDDVRFRGEGRHEPVLMTIEYGKGRTFHTVMGHVSGLMNETENPALECVGFITTFLRGAEWAATGEVTIDVPYDFPVSVSERGMEDEVRLWPNFRPYTLEELIDAARGYQITSSRTPLVRLEEYVRYSMRCPWMRKQTESALLGLLENDISVELTKFVCEQLRMMGSETSVDVLAAKVQADDIVVVTAACGALEKIPGAKAVDALKDALANTDGMQRITVVNALAARGDSQAVDAIAALVDSEDATLALSAIHALGKIGGDDAIGVLQNILNDARANRQKVMDALLRATRSSGKVGEKVYEDLMQNEQNPAIVRIAAFRGLVAMKGKGAGDLIAEKANSQDTVLRPAAVALVRDIDSSDAVIAIAKSMQDLSDSEQVRLLSALGDRGKQDVLEYVVKAAQSGDKNVRIAALRALRTVGSAKEVAMLAERAAAAKDIEQDAARESLYALRADGTNEAIIENIPEMPSSAQIELINAAKERNMLEAANTVLSVATNSEADMRARREALKVLRSIGSREQIEPLLQRLLVVTSGSERSTLENTLMKLLNTDELEKCEAAKMVLSKISSAENTETKASLFSLLASIGHPDGFPVLEEALKADDGKLRLASIRALSSWPNPQPLDALFEVAKSADSKKERILALRGSVRLLAMESDRSEQETMRIYREAIDMAEGAEKTRLLAQLVRVGSLSSLKMAALYLDDAGMQKEASLAAVQIAEKIWEEYPDPTREVLRKVRDVTDDSALSKRAQDVINQIEEFEDYIVVWEIAGPYQMEDATGPDLYRIAFAPEKGEAVEWRPFPGASPDGKPWLMDIGYYIGGANNVVYLRTKLHCEKALKAQLQMGSDDGIKVWLNGEYVHGKEAARGVKPREDIVEVTLKEGANELMVKINNYSGPWGCAVRVRGLDGSHIDELTMNKLGD